MIQIKKTEKRRKKVQDAEGETDMDNEGHSSKGKKKRHRKSRKQRHKHTKRYSESLKESRESERA